MRSHRTGGPQEVQDISWRSSPIGTVSCTAFVLSHRTGGPPEPPDISWPSSPTGVVSCTEEADEAEERKGKEGDRGKSYNHHTDGGEKWATCNSQHETSTEIGEAQAELKKYAN